MTMHQQCRKAPCLLAHTTKSESVWATTFGQLHRFFFTSGQGKASQAQPAHPPQRLLALEAAPGLRVPQAALCFFELLPFFLLALAACPADGPRGSREAALCAVDTVANVPAAEVLSLVRASGSADEPSSTA